MNRVQDYSPLCLWRGVFKLVRSSSSCLPVLGYGLLLEAMLIITILPAPAAAQDPRSAPATQNAAARPVRVLVVYYSLRGTTRQMADGVVEGVKRVAGAVPVVEPVEEVTKADLEAADGLALGCPAYFANIPGKMKLLMDDWNWKWKVNFTDKVGGAFATGGGQVGGKEHTIISLLLFMINNRMVVAGPLYQDEEGEDIWGEAGSAAMTGPLDPGVSNQELDSARLLGERLARLAKKLHANPLPERLSTKPAAEE
jgi:NAD(P)H dehydrogenase (quinone)